MRFERCRRPQGSYLRPQISAANPIAATTPPATAHDHSRSNALMSAMASDRAETIASLRLMNFISAYDGYTATLSPPYDTEALNATFKAS